MNRPLTLAVAISVSMLLACDSRPTQPAGDSAPPPSLAASRPAASEQPTAHDAGIVELGTSTAGEWTVRATRDKGELKAGGEAPIDVWVTDSNGRPATVTVVRFWIGTEDARDSVKARADIEDPNQPNHWHTHAELPSPLPSESRLWVEVEHKGKTSVVSFDIGARS